MNKFLNKKQFLKKFLNSLFFLKKNNKFVSLHEPDFDKSEIREVKKCLESTFVSTAGNSVALFENKIKKITKSNYVLSLINGTCALHLGLTLLGVKNNEEVLIPSITFAGTANAVKMAGSIPHFVDSEMESFGIDPIKLDNYLNKIVKIKGNFAVNKKTNRKISAIIVVHVFGHAAKIDQIIKISKKFKIPVIEDAAECIGSYFKKKHLGTFSDLGVLSFNGNKTITTGGGGALLLKKKNFYQLARLLSSGGKITHKWENIHIKPGYNYRMPAINAALGLGQIIKLNKFLKKKRRLYKKYNFIFRGFKEITLLREPKNSKSNYWLQAIILNKKYSKLKNKILKVTNENNIFTRPVWKPLHLLKHLKKYPKMNLKTSEEIYKRVINLPSGSNLL